jgi:phage-related holin
MIVSGGMATIRLALAYVTSSLDNWATKICSVAAGAAWGYIAQSDAEQSAIVGLAVLVLVDMLTGIMASMKTGKKLSSRRMSDTGVKLLGYLAILTAAASIRKIVGHPAGAAIMTASVIPFALTEASSIIENAHRMGIKATGGFAKLIAHLAQPEDPKPRGPKKVRETE